MKPLPMTAAPTSLSARPVKRLLLVARMVNGTVNVIQGPLGTGKAAQNRWQGRSGSAEPWAANQRIRLRPAWGWRIRRLGSKGHVVGMLFAIIGILLLNNGLTNGVVGLALVLLLYGRATSSPRGGISTKACLAGAKDAPEIHDGLDEILATIRPRRGRHLLPRAQHP